MARNVSMTRFLLYVCLVITGTFLTAFSQFDWAAGNQKYFLGIPVSKVSAVIIQFEGMKLDPKSNEYKFVVEKINRPRSA